MAPHEGRPAVADVAVVAPPGAQAPHSPRRAAARRAVGVVRWTLMAAAIAAICLSLAGLALGFQVVAVTSGSMRPGIDVGDALLVRKAGDKGVRVGDVIVFEVPTSKQMIAHRVVEVRDVGAGNYYRVKGDANNTTDANLVPGRSVFGRVIFRVPSVGRQLYWFSKVGMKLALALLFGLIFVEELGVLIPFLRRRRERHRAAR